MCNYGKSTPVAVEDMIEYVKSGLSLAPNEDGMMLLVSPSGSMLDEWEVPAQAREGILELVGKTNAKTYVCETRIETIADEKIKQYVEILDNKIKCIEVGLESSNPWVSKYCVNKELSLPKYIESMAILRKYQVLSIANVIVGSPFLSSKESINDAVETIRWAFSHGTDRCTLFPVHVKRWTLVEWLWKHDQYTPVSLWSLIEVLNQLGPELAQRVTISWYKLYIEKMARGRLNSFKDLGYLSSPTTCTLCYSKVINLLDTYRDTNDFSVIVELTSMSCTCKDVWRSTLEKKELLSLPERVASAYESIGRDVLGDRWWNKNGSGVLEEIKSSPQS
jgi:radical SAM enzyme (TIGR01210 family)